MQVLIVESKRQLGELWQGHLQRQGCSVLLATTGEEGIKILQSHEVEVIILDVFLDEGSALAVADFASYRQPKARVIFVTNTTFFSDGSIFQHVPNAAAFVRTETPVEDLVALVEHHGFRAETG